MFINACMQGSFLIDMSYFSSAIGADYPGNETQTWPPVGYGPTKIHDGPYFTPGLENREGYDTGDSFYNEQENGVHPYVPFYKNPKLMIPTGCLMGLALVVVGTVEVVRRRRLSKVRWS